MKYIRTKDGIYKTRQCYPEETLFENVTYVYRHEFVKNKDILKQADTIEELCDGFIFKDTHANELHFLDKNSGISLLGASLFEETLRGFIETDKGLIYVAKLNEEGNLELL